jgi:hypothetical protein
MEKEWKEEKWGQEFLWLEHKGGPFCSLNEFIFLDSMDIAKNLHVSCA